MRISSTYHRDMILYCPCGWRGSAHRPGALLTEAVQEWATHAETAIFIPPASWTQLTDAQEWASEALADHFGRCPYCRNARMDLCRDWRYVRELSTLAPDTFAGLGYPGGLPER